MNIDQFGLEWLLQPTDLEAFFTDTWEKRPLTLFRGDEAYFRPLLSLEDMDHILSSHDLRYPSVQLVKNSAPVPPPQYTTVFGEADISSSGIDNGVFLLVLRELHVKAVEFELAFTNSAAAA